MPNTQVTVLDVYKKQAKQLVRWHREGNYSIGERIRMLSRYRMLTDTQALALDFPLHEAQEIVAVEAGYESWAALKAAAAESPLDPKARSGIAALRKSIPVLYVSDVAASAAFLRDKLGFGIDFLHGHPAFYGAASRDGATLHLRFVHESVFKDGAREREQLIACFIEVDDVKSLYAEFAANGLQIDKPKKEPWGGATLGVRDLDGNTLYFSD